MTSREYCQTHRQGHLFTVVFSRPEVLNALNTPANFELNAVFDEFFADPDLWVCIVTGAGDRAFSAGNDVKSMGPDTRFPPGGFAGFTVRMHMEKPLIAAVNGVAAGGGFEAVLACDLAIAADTASFALLEPRIGIAAAWGGLQRLTRQIPMKHAMDLILTGRRIDAQEALAFGIVNEVVPPDQLMVRARERAEMILECSPLSIRASKQAINRGLEAGGLEMALKAQYECPLLKALETSEDFAEGRLAFLEKRKPQWTGL